MKQRWFLILGILALIALIAAGCRKKEEYNTTTAVSSSDTSGTTTTNPATSATTGSTTATASQLSDDDKKFMEKAAQGGMAEVSAGQMASSKGTSNDVKAFGQRMVTDHGKANDELKQLASTKGVTLPTDVAADQKKQADELGKKTGKDFDKQYAKDMVEDHDKDVKEFEEASKKAKDPDLKSWIDKTLPTLKDHQKMAHEMEKKVK
jgi:putative membrane protein